eukprot:777325-Amphidinium_carterae.1
MAQRSTCIRSSLGTCADSLRGRPGTGGPPSIKCQMVQISSDSCKGRQHTSLWSQSAEAICQISSRKTGKGCTQALCDHKCTQIMAQTIYRRGADESQVDMHSRRGAWQVRATNAAPKTSYVAISGYQRYTLRIDELVKQQPVAQERTMQTKTWADLLRASPNAIAQRDEKKIEENIEHWDTPTGDWEIEMKKIPHTYSGRQCQGKRQCNVIADYMKVKGYPDRSKA